MLADTTSESRQRITHLTVSGPRLEAVDRLRLVDAITSFLPSLAVLELSGDDGVGHLRGGDPSRCGQQPHGSSVCSVLAAAGGLPHIRRLVLDLQSEGEVWGVGALARCLQLRELTLHFKLLSRGAGAGASVAPCPPPLSAALDCLSQLPRLERLAMGGKYLCGRCEHILALAGPRRPPNLHSLTLLGPRSVLPPPPPTVEIAYEPAGGLPAARAAAGAAGAMAGGWRISRIHLSTGHVTDWDRQAVAPALLAAADCLGQRAIPELSFSRPRWSVWELSPAEVLDPMAALAQLLDRCERVDTQRLPVVRGGAGAGNQFGLLEGQLMLPAARVMGLPREVMLRHGEWLCREAVSAAGAASATATAALAPAVDGSTAPCEQELASQLQQLFRAGGGAEGGGELRLHLDTASPEEVLREAVARLWAEMEQGSSAEVASDGGGCTRGAGGGGRSPEQQAEPPVLALRGALPALQQQGSLRSVDCWHAWLQQVLSLCCLSPAATPATADDAQEWAARVPATGEVAALVVPERIAGAPEAALKRHVFQVLMEAWAPPASIAAAGGGGAGGGGCSSRSRSTIQPAAWAPGAATSSSISSTGTGEGRVSEEVLGRVERLLALDEGVDSLWWYGYAFRQSDVDYSDYSDYLDY
ncbi:hypothetical protein HXX76_015895 [Chlamydomonas incerta]|uniref:Uncharacterized protein n=1 Tax=Chlamydomonas incerta TaxID=51695 RepID=A0A835SFW2_CHLIN|nr:hypothetical protein HXX76_015895 [Chlamydomonas incerta]|eukprot:KAG2422658.1 hypothetical protein HXX76_015895 [Chlamydomonas incerta]